VRVLILFALLLSGCSSIYHPQQGWVPEGYSEERASEHQYTVQFESYRGEEWQQLEQYLIYRAAEIGAEHSYRYFLVNNLQNKEKVEVAETQAITVSMYNGIDSGANTEIPYTAFHHKIRTVKALITYTQKPLNDSYDVMKSLATISVD